MSNKTFLVVIAVIITAIAGVLVFSNNAETPSTNEELSALEVRENDHQKGAKTEAGVVNAAEEDGESKVVIMEYGDFQCPACAGVYPLIEQALVEYEDDVTFVFRHFPLTQIHPNAMVSHRAAEAAGEQDKFFEMYDQLYASQQQWSESDSPFDIIRSYAEEIELDMDKFEEDYNASASLSRVQQDLDSGGELGVTGTPTFYVNGEETSFGSYEDIQAAIEDALTESEDSEQQAE